jgi:hypothetical protein
MASRITANRLLADLTIWRDEIGAVQVEFIYLLLGHELSMSITSLLSMLDAAVEQPALVSARIAPRCRTRVRDLLCGWIPACRLGSDANDTAPLKQICARVDRVNRLQEELPEQQAASDEVRHQLEAFVTQCHWGKERLNRSNLSLSRLVPPTTSRRSSH